MSLRNKIAVSMLYFVSFLCIITAIVYLFSPAIMPYHVKFLGKTQNQLEPKTAALLIFAMRLIGGCMLSIGVVLAVLVKNIFSGIKWIPWTIFVMMTIVFTSSLYVMLSVGLFTPWWIVITGLLLTYAGLILIHSETV